MARWQPAPGKIALYRGRTKAQTRIVRILAEAVGNCMVVEAVGKQGHNVRLTVKRSSLLEPQPDLFG